jgi:hypothetical protein
LPEPVILEKEIKQEANHRKTASFVAVSWRNSCKWQLRNKIVANQNTGEYPAKSAGYLSDGIAG